MNKRGVSVMVGYVLLVVIAVGLSIGVYSYLKVLVPKDKPECQNDVLLIIDSATCEIDPREGLPDKLYMEITLKNRGLFRISAAYVRFAQEERRVREWINPDGANGGLDEQFYFGERRTEGLDPGDTITWSLEKEDIEPSPTGVYTIEVQPTEWSSEWGSVVCSNAVITQDITCSGA